MLILAAVPHSLKDRLSAAARSPFDLMLVPSWEEVVSAILRLPVEMAVLDPALEDELHTYEIERLRVLFPSLPIILYTNLSARVAPALLSGVGFGPRGLHQTASQKARTNNGNRCRNLQ